MKRHSVSRLNPRCDILANRLFGFALLNGVNYKTNSVVSLFDCDNGGSLLEQ